MSAFKCTSFVYGNVTVEDTFDQDDELEVKVESGKHINCAWLPREEVVRLRDHLNTVLELHND